MFYLLLYLFFFLSNFQMPWPPNWIAFNGVADKLRHIIKQPFKWKESENSFNIFIQKSFIISWYHIENQLLMSFRGTYYDNKCDFIDLLGKNLLPVDSVPRSSTTVDTLIYYALLFFYIFFPFADAMAAQLNSVRLKLDQLRKRINFLFL